MFCFTPRMGTIAVVALLVSALSGDLSAGDINVPGDYPMIQDAIDAAFSGDRILVADGTYYENIDFIGKEIEVRSVNGLPSVVIDGNGGGNGCQIKNGEGPGAILAGFVLTNCAQGIYCNSTSPRLEDLSLTGNVQGLQIYKGSPFVVGCTISNNTADPVVNVYQSTTSFTECVIENNTGRGMTLDGTNATLLRCKFFNNVSSGSGGGVYCDNGDAAVFTDCDIMGNWASSGGGAVLNDYCTAQFVNAMFSGNNATSIGGGLQINNYSNPTLVDCTIQSNTSGGGGGGIIVHSNCTGSFTRCQISNNLSQGTSSGQSGGGANLGGANTVFTECTFEGNQATDNGGGITILSSAPVFERCVIKNNDSGDLGGGIYMTNPSGVVDLENCMICDNTAANNGGGIYGWGAKLQITNSTAADNIAAAGGGFYLEYYTSDVDLVNAIVWGNTPDSIALIGATCDAVYSDIAGGWPGNGNIDADPEFVGTDDWHIAGSSPCVATGTSNGAVYPFIPFDDIDGEDRPQGTKYDMGADEVAGGGSEFFLVVSPDPLQSGQTGTFTVNNGRPFAATWLGYSIVGPGSFYLPPLNVTLGLSNPRRAAGPATTNSEGDVDWQLPIPVIAAGRSVWVQAVQYGQATNVVATAVQ